MAYITFQPKDYFNTLTYTGTGSSNALTGVGFRPDFVWIKGRDFSDNHNLYDIVRGVEKRIVSNSTGVEEDRPAGLTAFGSDGFTVNTANGENKSSAPIVAWNWRAANAQGSSNTDGSVNTTYTSVNTTSGFSISKYTNPSSGSPFTVGHGLGAAPKVIIIKNLSATQTWGVWHTGIAFGKYLRLDDTASQASANLVTATSNTTFSTYQDHHSTGNELIAYCFAEIKGFSRFGSYTGNGNDNGPYIYCGFKPALVMAKRYDSGSEDWNVWDNKRIGYNIAGNDKLYWNLSSAESTGSDEIDILSNGFKWRTTNGGLNASGGSYIYMAFAEEPLVASNGDPATAR
tara:strand:- start:285 stop:1316 length:1032 start_codon:yes stop_codon:yes gene_type:complete